MKIITVSGAHSGVGKTRVAEALLSKLRDWSAIKVTVSHKGVCPIHRDCGACGGWHSNFSIVSDRSIIEQREKDTQRFKVAGAKNVLWLRARPEGLRQGIKKAIAKLKNTKGIIIEGNSILKYIKPDLAIFVKTKKSGLKPSAKEIFNKVDLMITL
jgi:dethiobiotin synthetase